MMSEQMLRAAFKLCCVVVRTTGHILDHDKKKLLLIADRAFINPLWDKPDLQDEIHVLETAYAVEFLNDRNDFHNACEELLNSFF